MSRSPNSRRSFLKAASAREWALQTEARFKAMAVWKEFCNEYDAFLMPV